MNLSAEAIVVIGAGPVGVALAINLKKGARAVILIEAGGEKWDSALEAETLRAGRKTPGSHPEAHLFRRRMLGGASNVWGGRCLPFEPIDFEPLSSRAGWPLEYDSVAKFYPEALRFLDAGNWEFDASAFERSELLRVDDALDTSQIERFSLPTDAWKRYRDDLNAAGVQVLRHCLVRQIILSEDGQNVRALDTVNTQTGVSEEIPAGIVILACGGIETPRLLLASRTHGQNGLGNAHDLVGRHYMTHLIGDVGEMRFAPDVSFRQLDYRVTRDGIYARTIMRLSPELRRNLGLPSILWRPNIPPIWNPSHGNAILSAMHFAKSLAAREYAQRLNSQGRNGNKTARNALGDNLGHIKNLVSHPLSLANFTQNWIRKRILAKRKLPSVFLPSANGTFAMELNAEQIPDAESRITLAPQTDKFGMPLINLDWKMGASTLSGVRDSMAKFRQAVANAGLGEFTYDTKNLEASLSAQGGHHIGTARMAADPSKGVVDPDCKVFGIGNLYVAGSSVFPTSSSSNPTLVAVALALRLAKHLKNGV